MGLNIITKKDEKTLRKINDLLNKLSFPDLVLILDQVKHLQEDVESFSKEISSLRSRVENLEKQYGSLSEVSNYPIDDKDVKRKDTYSMEQMFNDFFKDPDVFPQKKNHKGSE